MKRYSLFIAILFFCFSPLCAAQGIRPAAVDEAFTLLKGYRDKEALVIFEEILAIQPDNFDVRWGTAEILRRDKKYREAEIIFRDILRINPQHAPSLNSLAYLRYRENSLPQAMDLAQQVLRINKLNKEDKAMAYMVVGMVNSKKSSFGGLFNKVYYGTQIKAYFQKAVELAPDMAEVYLGLGTFYLLAPKIAGGDLDKAIKELEYAIHLAPTLATATVRLAQVYQKKGDSEKYRIYLARAQELDPGNEALKTIMKNGESIK